MASAPEVAVAVAAPLAVAAAWLFVRRGRTSIWGAMGAAMGILGIAAVATGRPAAATEVAAGVAALVGAGAGVALYAATAGFMAVARTWPPLAHQAASLYAQRGGMSLPASLAVAAAVVAPGEELVWRGVVQSLLSEPAGPAVGAVVAWVAYVAANAVSGSVPILLGAVVGGAAWGGLALWSGGVLAGTLCHAIWTGLMIARPPLDR